MIRAALREPLLRFLTAGLLLFVLFELLSTDDNEGARSIVVDEGDLVLFARHRYRKFGPEEAETWVRELGAGTLKDVIDDFVREETLFREAKALQLDRDDYTGRQRLISQLEFINRGFIRDNLKLSDADLQSFYSANRDRYFIPAKITFAHVFFSMNLHDDQTEALARSRHQSLNHDNIQFNRSGQGMAGKPYLAVSGV